MAKKRKNTWWRFAVIIALMLGFYYWRPLTNGADCAFAHVSGAVLQYYHAVAQKIHSFENRTQDTQALSQELVRVQQERGELFAQLVELRSQQRYADDIQELAQFRQRSQQVQDARIVHILLKHFGDDSHYFLVGGGTNDGFMLNMIATINNHLIGRVVEVYPAYSKVQLITDKMMKVAACCTKTKAHGIFTGLCKINEAQLNFVDHLQEIIPGDMVLSSGTGLLYPQGLCVGAIVQAIKKDVAYDILVKPQVSFEQLDYCLLLPPLLVSQQSVPTGQQTSLHGVQPEPVAVHVPAERVQTEKVQTEKVVSQHAQDVSDKHQKIEKHEIAREQNKPSHVEQIPSEPIQKEALEEAPDEDSDSDSSDEQVQSELKLVAAEPSVPTPSVQQPVG